MIDRSTAFGARWTTVVRWCAALLFLTATGRIAAHPAYMTSAVATIERDGRFLVTVRFDALAFASFEVGGFEVDGCASVLSPLMTPRRIRF